MTLPTLTIEEIEKLDGEDYMYAMENYHEQMAEKSEEENFYKKYPNATSSDFYAYSLGY